MTTPLGFATQFAATVIAAEFTSGVIHWIEDAYIREDTPYVGKIVGRPNMIHHHFPRYMTRNNWWQSSWDLVILALILLVIARYFGLLTWHVWLFALLASNANEFHKWEHRTRKENGPVISFLQDIHLLQSGKHHALHHTDPKNSHYCTMTNVLNPILDRVGLWECLEWLLSRSIGLKRRPDTSVRGCGPGPDWLKGFSPQKLSHPVIASSQYHPEIRSDSPYESFNQ
jgi:ubiquitin-conjugating enzyme E2 variant